MSKRNRSRRRRSRRRRAEVVFVDEVDGILHTSVILACVALPAASTPPLSFVLCSGRPVGRREKKTKNKLDRKRKETGKGKGEGEIQDKGERGESAEERKGKPEKMEKKNLNEMQRKDTG